MGRVRDGQTWPVSALERRPVTPENRRMVRAQAIAQATVGGFLVDGPKRPHPARLRGRTRQEGVQPAPGLPFPGGLVTLTSAQRFGGGSTRRHEYARHPLQAPIVFRQRSSPVQSGFIFDFR